MDLNRKLLFFSLFFSLFCLLALGEFTAKANSFSTPENSSISSYEPKVSPIFKADRLELLFLSENYSSQKTKEPKEIKSFLNNRELRFDPKVSLISLQQVLGQQELDRLKRNKSKKQFKKPTQVSKQEWRKILKSVANASEKNQLPEELILALIKKESSFKRKAVSRSGAVGLTQIKPATAKYECGLSAWQLTDIDLNIQCGTSYLSKLLKIFNGRLDLAITSYNAGPGAVKRAIKRANSKDLGKVIAFLSQESREFAPKVFRYSKEISSQSKELD